MKRSAVAVLCCACACAIAACTAFGTEGVTSSDAGAAVPATPDAAAVPLDAASPSEAGISAYRDMILADKPVAYWRMNVQSEAVIVPDETTNHYDLQLAGSGHGFGAPGAIAGDPDTAITFDGAASYATLDPRLSRALDFAENAPFTVECWARRHAIDGGTTFAHILGNSDSNSTQRVGYIFYVVLTSPVQVRFEDDGLVDGGVRAGYVQSSQSPTGNYVHYAVTFDGVSLSILVNGLVDGLTLMPPAPMPTRGGQLVVGHDANSSNSFFPGELDEIAIYPRALDASTIAHHHAVGIGSH